MDCFPRTRGSRPDEALDELDQLPNFSASLDVVKHSARVSHVNFFARDKFIHGCETYLGRSKFSVATSRHLDETSIPITDKTPEQFQ
jgi:hypothetical protein